MADAGVSIWEHWNISALSYTTVAFLWFNCIQHIVLNLLFPNSLWFKIYLYFIYLLSNFTISKYEIYQNLHISTNIFFNININ